MNDAESRLEKPLSAGRNSRFKRFFHRLKSSSRVNIAAIVLSVTLLTVTLGLIFIEWKDFHPLYSEPDIEKIHEATAIDTFKVEGDPLKSILIERVAGTQGNKKVREFLVKTMRSYGWDVSVSEFWDSTIMGKVQFANIAATLGSSERGFNKEIVIGAHYDSKYFSEGNFVGAIDSAGPIAILLDVAKFLGTNLLYKSPHIPVTIVFFDGEEAFGDWNTGSLFGSRHLAEEWEKSGRLKNIECLILLDLLGHKETSVVSLLNGEPLLYQLARRIQSEMIDKGIISETLSRRLKKNSLNTYFRNENYAQPVVEDDDLPFNSKGVRTLNIISYPFPDFHHTLQDSPDKLVPEVLMDLSIIVKKMIFKLSWDEGLNHL